MQKQLQDKLNPGKHRLWSADMLTCTTHADAGDVVCIQQLNHVDDTQQPNSSVPGSKS